MTVLQSRILSSEVESFSFFCLEILFRVKPRMCAIVKKNRNYRIGRIIYGKY